MTRKEMKQVNLHKAADAMVDYKFPWSRGSRRKALIARRMETIKLSRSYR